MENSTTQHPGLFPLPPPPPPHPLSNDVAVDNSNTEPLDLSNFKKLPLELREKIWANLITPRLVQIKFRIVRHSKFHGPYSPNFYRHQIYDPRSDPQYSSRIMHVTPDEVELSSVARLPVISKVCKESRNVFQTFYYPWMTKNQNGLWKQIRKQRHIWINGAIDRVYVIDHQSWRLVCEARLEGFFTQGSLTSSLLPASGTGSSNGTCESPAMRRRRDIKSLVMHDNEFPVLLKQHCNEKLRNGNPTGWLDWVPACTEIIVMATPDNVPRNSRNACMLRVPDVEDETGSNIIFQDWEWRHTELGYRLDDNFDMGRASNKWYGLTRGSGYPRIMAGSELDRFQFGLAILGDSDGRDDANDTEFIVEGPANESLSIQRNMQLRGLWTKEGGFTDE